MIIKNNNIISKILFQGWLHFWARRSARRWSLSWCTYDTICWCDLTICQQSARRRSISWIKSLAAYDMIWYLWQLSGVCIWYEIMHKWSMSWRQLSGVCSHDRSVLYFLWSIIDEDLFPSQVPGDYDDLEIIKSAATWLLWWWPSEVCTTVERCNKDESEDYDNDDNYHYDPRCARVLRLATTRRARVPLLLSWENLLHKASPGVTHLIKIIDINDIIKIIVIKLIDITITVVQDKTAVLPRHLRLPLGLWRTQHLALRLTSFSRRGKNVNFLIKWISAHLEKINLQNLFINIGHPGLGPQIKFLTSKVLSLANRIKIGWNRWMRTL